MAGTPRWKIYNAAGGYTAAVRHLEDGARLVAGREGWTIRSEHAKRSTVWTEGSETQSAGESFDFVAELGVERLAARQTAQAKAISKAPATFATVAPRSGKKPPPARLAIYTEPEP